MSIIQIKNWMNGLADAKYQGASGSFAPNTKSVDIHREPGVLQGAYSLAKDSGTTVTDLPLWSFQGSDTSSYFGGNAGKIYKRTSGGSWSNPYTTSAGARICGMEEYNDYIFWATSCNLYQVKLSSLGSGEEQYNALTSAWGTSGVTWAGDEIDAEWHPMQIMPNGDLAVGAGRHITTVDTGSLASIRALTMPKGWRARCLGSQGDYLTIGCWKSSLINEGMVLLWEGYAESGFTPVPVSEGKVNAFLQDGNSSIVSAGMGANLYVLGSSGLQLVKKIPGVITPGKRTDVYPDAITRYGGVYMVGISDDNSSPSKQGVYTFGSPNVSYPTALNFEYPISPNQTSAVKIGSILATGTELFVGWQAGATYGVDRLSSSRYTAPVYESMLIWNQRKKRLCKKIHLLFEPLPTSCAVNVKYKSDFATSWTNLATANTANQTELDILTDIPAHTFEMQVNLTCNSTDSPRITQMDIEYDDTQI